MPLTTRAMKLAALIQCVTRTRAEWREHPELPGPGVRRLGDMQIAPLRLRRI
jgi:hypothetical protein